jgi:hypothetical protein
MYTLFPAFLLALGASLKLGFGIANNCSILFFLDQKTLFRHCSPAECLLSTLKPSTCMCRRTQEQLGGFERNLIVEVGLV